MPTGLALDRDGNPLLAPLTAGCLSLALHLIWVNKLHQDSSLVKQGWCMALFGKYFGASSEDIPEMLKTSLLHFCCCLNWANIFN